MPDMSNSTDKKIEAYRHDKALNIVIRGDWLLDGMLPNTDPLLRQIESDQTLESILFSTSALGRWDSLLITELIKLIDRFQSSYG